MRGGASSDPTPTANAPAARRAEAAPSGEGDVRAAFAHSPLVGLLAAAPALVTALSGEASAGAMAVVWGATASLAGALAGVIRAARSSPSLRLLGAATLLAAAPLAGFAAVVKQVTHHRPLGAATIAVAGLVLVAGALIVVHRLTVLAAARSASFGRAARSLIEAVAMVALLGTAAVALGWSTADGRATVVQLGLLIAAVAALAALPVPRCAPGRPLAVTLLVVPATIAVAVALGHPAALGAAARAAPWLAPFVSG